MMENGKEYAVMGVVFKGDPGLVLAHGTGGLILKLPEPVDWSTHIDPSESFAIYVTIVVSAESIAKKGVVRVMDTHDPQDGFSKYIREVGDGFCFLKEEYCRGYEAAEMFLMELRKELNEEGNLYVYTTEELKDKLDNRMLLAKYMVTPYDPQTLSRIQYLSPGEGMFYGEYDERQILYDMVLDADGCLYVKEDYEQFFSEDERDIIKHPHVHLSQAAQEA